MPVFWVWLVGVSMNSRAYAITPGSTEFEQNAVSLEKLGKATRGSIEWSWSWGSYIHRTACYLLQPHSTIHGNDGHDINWQSTYFCPHWVQKFEYFPLIKGRGSPKQTRGSTKYMELTSKGNRDWFKMLQRNLLKCPLDCTYHTHLVWASR